MAYYAKKQSKYNKKIVITVIVIALLIITSLIYFSQNNKEEKEVNKFSVCGYNEKQMVNNLNKTFKDTYSINDYLFYGESFVMLHDAYNPETADSISGKTVILKDQCNDVEYSFVVENNLDRNILLNKLTPGFYEVYIMENYIEKRVISNNVINDSIDVYAMSSGENKVDVIADADILSDYNTKTDNNYLFINVSETKLKQNEYDIALDPAGNAADFTYLVDKGSEGHGLSEYKESYKACVKIKKELEDKGFKVLILRSEDEEINSYGEDGRLAKAYNAKVKYYFRIGFNESDIVAYNGSEIYYSTYASKVLSSQIIYDLTKNTALVGSSVYSKSGEDGLIQCTLVKGKDNRIIYDNDLWVREAGGKATNAGLYSDNAIEGVGSFATNNNKGIYALNISLLYFTNNEDAQLWKDNSDLICTTVANSIYKYLNPGEE